MPRTEPAAQRDAGNLRKAAPEEETGLKASNQGGISGEPVPSLRVIAGFNFSKKDFDKR